MLRRPLNRAARGTNFRCTARLKRPPRSPACYRQARHRCSDQCAQRFFSCRAIAWHGYVRSFVVHRRKPLEQPFPQSAWGPQKSRLRMIPRRDWLYTLRSLLRHCATDWGRVSGRKPSALSNAARKAGVNRPAPARPRVLGHPDLRAQR